MYLLEDWLGVAAQHEGAAQVRRTPLHEAIVTTQTDKEGGTEQISSRHYIGTQGGGTGLQVSGAREERGTL